jgi:hypothetical protein
MGLRTVTLTNLNLQREYNIFGGFKFIIFLKDSNMKLKLEAKFNLTRENHCAH